MEPKFKLGDVVDYKGNPYIVCLIQFQNWTDASKGYCYAVLDKKGHTHSLSENELKPFNNKLDLKLVALRQKVKEIKSYYGACGPALELIADLLEELMNEPPNTQSR